ncbi:unnamed protein product [Urochloa humidicola]
MAPTTIPPSFPSSFPRHHRAAAATITITISSDSDSGSSVRSVVDVSSDGDGEATSKRKWSLEDERAVLATIADLRRVNSGVKPPAWKILDRLRRNGAFTQHGLRVRDLAKKVSDLKRQIATSVKKAAANGGKLRRKTKHRNKVLYRESPGAWPELFKDAGAS